MPPTVRCSTGWRLPALCRPGSSQPSCGAARRARRGRRLRLDRQQRRHRRIPPRHPPGGAGRTGVDRARRQLGERVVTDLAVTVRLPSGSLAPLLTIDKRALWPALFTSRTLQPVHVISPYRDIAVEQVVLPSYTALLHPTARDLALNPYFVDWRSHFDYVLVLQPGRLKDEAPLLPQPVTAARRRRNLHAIRRRAMTSGAVARAHPRLHRFAMAAFGRVRMERRTESDMTIQRKVARCRLSLLELTSDFG
jgi:hypothetical protein